MRQWLRSAGASVLGIAFGAFAVSAAQADGSVSSLRMGMGARDMAAFQRFEDVIQRFNASGERFRIDSHCQSACTMFLSIRNVCVSPGATLLFHSGGSVSRNRVNPVTTQRMLSTYNAALQKYVTDNHYMDTFAFHAISGRDIIGKFGYPACR